ncbi:MAG: hypothetical protein KDK76_01535 [Chlamydiia bacterium]|nr:hypothetical protein [Chlamydiia bacterium]
MKIALIGYGKMGKAVKELSQKSGHTCVVGLDPSADVSIDFSSGEGVKKTALSIQTPWVLGTTGWSREEVLSIAQERNLHLLYAPNFSFGVALFRRMAKIGKTLLKGFELEGCEIHHEEKKDAPSGTALKLMEEISGLTFTSVRQGKELGTHQLLFKGSDEEIELTHRAKDRTLFAQGALLGAKWLLGKERGIYTFDDLIEEEFPCPLEKSLQH